MGTNTTIEWADHTFNAWMGCTKIGPGCAHCYAEATMDTRLKQVRWGAGNPRRRTSDANWKQPLAWNAKAEREHAAWQAGLQMANGDEAELIAHGFFKPQRPRVFCASLADWLDNEVPIEWLVDLLDLIRRTPFLDWLLLSKRIGNWKTRLEQAVVLLEHRIACGRGENGAYAMARNWLAGEPPANIWIGATFVNQTEYDRDIGKILRTPAALRFMSGEPMLGHIDMRMGGAAVPNCAEHRPLPQLDWVICGGESGAHARPMHPDWVRALRDQCAAAGVPFLFKQWGEWLPISQQDEAFTNRLYRSKIKAALHEDQGALDESYGRTCVVPVEVVHFDGSRHGALEPMAFLQGTGAMTTFKVGKKAAGRKLDGIEHNAFPVPR